MNEKLVPDNKDEVMDLVTEDTLHCSSSDTAPVASASDNVQQDTSKRSPVNSQINDLGFSIKTEKPCVIDLCSDDDNMLQDNEPDRKRRKIHMTEEMCFSHQRSEEGMKPLSNPMQVSLSSSSTPKKYLIPRPGRQKSKPADRHTGHSSSSNSCGQSSSSQYGSVSSGLVDAFQNNIAGGFGKASRMYDITRSDSPVSQSFPSTSCDNSSKFNPSATAFSSKLKSNARSAAHQSKITDTFKSCLSQSEQAEIDALYTSQTELKSPLKRVSGSVYISDDSCSPLSSSQGSNVNIKDNPVVKQLFEAQKTLTSATKPKHPRRYQNYAHQNKWNHSKGSVEIKSEEMSIFDDKMSESDDEAMSEALDKVCTYGLLGGDEHEEKIDYFGMLPDEVVENILCHLPMLDLCLNSNRVCTRWSSIISSDKFMPWKKLYHKMKKDVGDSRKQVKALMDNHGMTLPSTYLLGLIRYMKDFKIAHGNTAECLSKHKKYSWAKALLEERAQDCITNNDPNPWSVMTVLAIISESVKDVQEIIECMSVPFSDCTTQEILECLYCISTFLLAFKLAKPNEVWNGMHYRLFYALYLYENESSTSYGDLREALGNRSGQQSIVKYGDAGRNVKLTHEQMRIVNHNCKPAEIIKIVAFAGTGKTTTLVRYTQLRPDTRFLLVVYNKSVCDHAKTKFPYNVKCMTGHALAFSKIGIRYKNAGKFKGYGPSVYSLTQTLKPRKGDNLFVRAKFVLDTVNSFFASADAEITENHVPESRMNDKGVMETVDFQKKKLYKEDAQYLWSRMQNLKDNKVPMSHDGYLKLYQLSQPKLHYNYDCILIDEAQDLTPALSDILLSQRISKILVGDPHQQIYSFRGAINSMQQVRASTIFYLTQSFRFGPEIAQVAACCLETLKNERKKTLVGNGQRSAVLGDTEGQVAILTRCNFTLFNEAVKQCCYKESDEKISFVGGTDGFGFPMIQDIYALMLSPEQRAKDKRVIQNKLINSFRNLAELEKYATKVHDNELLGKIKIVKTHNHNLPVFINKILSKHTSDQRTADIILSTAHKAKGLEFSTVRLTDDYNINPAVLLLLRHLIVGDVVLPMTPVAREPNTDESNLLYVAVTRAKHALQMTSTLRNILKQAGLTYTYPMLSTHLKEKGVTFKCKESGEEFQPYALTLYKKEIKLVEGMLSGGVYSPQTLTEENSCLSELLGMTDEDKKKAEEYEEQRRQ